MDNVTPIRTRHRGTGRTNTPAPHTADWYDQEAAKGGPWADMYAAEADRLRAQDNTAQAA